MIGENNMAEATAKWPQSVSEEKQQHSEGVVARTIEQQTAKLPSDVFLWSALGAIGVSLYLELTGNEEKARFVGQWVSPFLLLGLYNKIVKVAGSDRTRNQYSS
jgi:hypothetical protein